MKLQWWFWLKCFGKLTYSSNFALGISFCNSSIMLSPWAARKCRNSQSKKLMPTRQYIWAHIGCNADYSPFQGFSLPLWSQSIPAKKLQLRKFLDNDGKHWLNPSRRSKKLRILEKRQIHMDMMMRKTPMSDQALKHHTPKSSSRRGKHTAWLQSGLQNLQIKPKWVWNG